MTENTIIMPDAATIVERLRGVIHLGSDFDRIFRTFADEIAGQEANAHGVNLSWELAVYKIASKPGATPMLGTLLDKLFGRLMRGMLPDASEFAEEIIAAHFEVLSEVNDSTEDNAS